MAGNNRNKKKRENYFQQNINRSGENFINTLPLDRMKLDVVRVFRELARGDIDIETYGKYFLNDRFLEACIDTAAVKYNFYKTSADGVNMLLKMNMVGCNTYDIFDFHTNAAAAYGLIWNKFSEFRNIKDLNILLELVLNLAKYRYYV